MERLFTMTAGVTALGTRLFGRYGEGYVRFSYANSQENIRKALDRVAQEIGVTSIERVADALAAMEEHGLLLLVHGEVTDPDVDLFDREAVFIERILKPLLQRHPELKVVMEHITTAEAVEFVDNFTNISATVTLHHLMITLDDVIGNLMEPDLFCKPIAKKPKDLKSIANEVFSGHPRIMFGSN